MKLASLSEGVEQVFMRQDTAAYATEVLAWSEREKEHPKYGRILFTIYADVTSALRDTIAKVTDWTPEVTHGKHCETGVGRGCVRSQRPRYAERYLRALSLIGAVSLWCRQLY